MQPKSDIVTSEIFNEKQFNFCLQTKDRVDSLCEKYQNTEVFLVRIFFFIRTEYGDLPRKSPYSVRIHENTDQKNLRIWTLFTQ